MFTSTLLFVAIATASLEKRFWQEVPTANHPVSKQYF